MQRRSKNRQDCILTEHHTSGLIKTRNKGFLADSCTILFFNYSLKDDAVPRLNTNEQEYLDVECLEDPKPTDVTPTVDTPITTAKRKKVEKRYYVQGRNDLFEVLVLESQQ